MPGAASLIRLMGVCDCTGSKLQAKLRPYLLSSSSDHMHLSCYGSLASRLIYVLTTPFSQNVDEHFVQSGQQIQCHNNELFVRKYRNTDSRLTYFILVTYGGVWSANVSACCHRL